MKSFLRLTGAARLVIAGLLAVLAAGSVPAQAQRSDAENWATYENPRLGTSILYPAQCFAAEPPPANMDGRRFVDADSGGEFIVFGQLNYDRLSLAKLEARMVEARAQDRITYRASKQNWVVLSGFTGDQVFYERAMLSEDGRVLHAFAITYPRSAKPVYDPLVTVMSRSLKAGQGVAVD